MEHCRKESLHVLDNVCWNCNRVGHESSACVEVTGSGEKALIKSEVRVLHKILQPRSFETNQLKLQRQSERQLVQKGPGMSRRAVLNKMNEIHGFWDGLEADLKLIKEVNIRDLIRQGRAAEELKKKFLSRRMEVSALIVQAKKGFMDHCSGISSSFYQEKFIAFNDRRERVWNTAFTYAKRIEKAIQLFDDFRRLMSIEEDIVEKVSSLRIRKAVGVTDFAKEFCANYSKLTTIIDLLGKLTEPRLFSSYESFLERNMDDMIALAKKEEYAPALEKIKNLEKEKHELQVQLKRAVAFSAQQM